MSELNPPSRAPLPARTPLTVPHYVEIFCTGKGSHRRASTQFQIIAQGGAVHDYGKGKFQRCGDGEWLFTQKRGDIDGGGEYVERFADLAGIRRLKCPRCPRDTQVTAANFVKRLDGLKKSARSSLDLSHLSF